MSVPHYPSLRSTVLAACLALAFAPAHADDVPTTRTTASSASTTSHTVGTSTTTETRLSNEFAGFLGSEQQAGAVVAGLRQGTAFTLGSDSASTTIDPPTGTMGYGNVRIALRLAQAELGQLGITQPTGEELSAVLLGGEINGTQLDGILSLRAEGMGWGRIAQQYGMTVGQLMGKGTGLRTHSPTTPQTSSGRGSAGARASGATAHANGYIPSGRARGTGMVTAAGENVGGSAYGSSKAHGPTAGTKDTGMASASGQQVSAPGASNAAGGSSMGMARGRSTNN